MRSSTGGKSMDARAVEPALDRFFCRPAGSDLRPASTMELVVLPLWYESETTELAVLEALERPLKMPRAALAIEERVESASRLTPAFIMSRALCLEVAASETRSIRVSTCGQESHRACEKHKTRVTS